jgi:hypothetical protein
MIRQGQERKTYGQESRHQKRCEKETAKINKREKTREKSKKRKQINTDRISSLISPAMLYADGGV